jgi:hypothetical protein
MTLSVIGAGFGRTGTHSLKLALEALGLNPCHHMYEVRDNPRQLGFWQAAVSGQKVDWDEVFRGYMAQVDWPGSRFWKELSSHFPEAKVILTVRDADAWFDSLQATVLPSITIGRAHDPDPHTRGVAEMVYQTVHEQLFGGRMSDRDHVLAVFREHISEVQSTLPSDRLLTFDVKDGWEPLCAFLNLPVPNLQFPKTNSTEEFLSKKKFLR